MDASQCDTPDPAGDAEQNLGVLEPDWQLQNLVLDRNFVVAYSDAGVEDVKAGKDLVQPPFEDGVRAFRA